jgi:indole-3-glycerol phosphate synthase
MRGKPETVEPVMSFLEQVVEERRKAVKEAAASISSRELLDQVDGREHHSLAGSLANASGPCIIAEVKKASPSAGLLSEDYRPADQARLYAGAGAAAISVLTEPVHFLGSGEHLRAVRQSVALPVLRKDFICDPYQLHEALAWGADVILLIVAAIDGVLLRDLYEEATERGLEVLAEAHSESELECALELPMAIPGVNSRDLKSLTTDISRAEVLGPRLPAGRVAVAESGIRTADDVRRLWKSGYRGFLVGETLMKAVDPAAAVRNLRGSY